MKITFIRVNMFEKQSSDAMKPLIFSIIAGLTPKNIELEFFDDRIELLPEKISSDIIAFSVETFAAKRAFILAKKYKTMNNIIVMGGFHPTAMPDECLTYADCILIGDAEDTWNKLLEDFKKGTVKKKYISNYSCNLNNIDYDYSIYKYKYHNIGVAQFSRGCKFNCDFCSIKAMYPNVRQKKIQSIVEELKKSKERIFFFIDDNLFFDKVSARELFKAIKPLKKKWACQVSMDVVQDDLLLSEMKNCGCFLVLIGFESLNQESLKQMNKSANIAQQNYKDVVSKIYKHGLMIYATFVLGYDYDDETTFKKTFQFAIDSNFAVANFNPLIPMPGTKLYKRLEAENSLIYKKWWLSDCYHYGDTAYIPKILTPAELRNGCQKVRFEYYSTKNILKRLFRTKLYFTPYKFVLYLIMNFISKREIHKKQSKLLGGILNETDVD